MALHWLLPRLAELAQSEVSPPPYITGDDLTALGMQPGPGFKRILDSVYDAQLELRIGDKTAALALAQQLAR